MKRGRLVQVLVLLVVAVLVERLTPGIPSFASDENRTTALQTEQISHNNKASTYSCQVASVHDGDSMRVRCGNSRDTIRIRLYQIDAPELNQTYGPESRKALLKMCPVKSRVKVHDYGTDTYDRILAYVSCQDSRGRNIEDVNAEMIKQGAAWVYHHYRDNKRLSALEQEARFGKKGLWAHDNVTSPRQFRSQ